MARDNVVKVHRHRRQLVNVASPAEVQEAGDQLQKRLDHFARAVDMRFVDTRREMLKHVHEATKAALATLGETLVTKIAAQAETIEKQAEELTVLKSTVAQIPAQIAKIAAAQAVAAEVSKAAKRRTTVKEQELVRGKDKRVTKVVTRETEAE